MDNKVVQFQDYYKNQWKKVGTLIQGTIFDLAHDLILHPEREFENVSYCRSDRIPHCFKQIGSEISWVKPETNLYMQDISVRGRIAKIDLSLRFLFDIVKEAKAGLPRGYVVKKLLEEVENIRRCLMSGEDPFYESLNKSYIVFEVEGFAPGDSQGTLASFRGVQPVEPVSLVDTDGKEKCLIPKEVKKDVFVLRPTPEQLRMAILRNIKNSHLQEAELRYYYYLATVGKINILKECMSESSFSKLKRCSDTIRISNIYNM